MAELTVQRVDKDGILDLAGALAAADVAGDSVSQASGLLVVMDNRDASPHTLTVAAPSATADCGDLGALGVDAIALAVGAGEIGLLAIPQGYGDGALLSWTYDDVTTVFIGVFSNQP